MARPQCLRRNLIRLADAANSRRVARSFFFSDVFACQAAVVCRDPAGVDFGDRIGAAQVGGRGLPLRELLLQTVNFGGASLVKARLLLQVQDAAGYQ